MMSLRLFSSRHPLLSGLLFWTGLFLFYTALTLVLYYHRLPTLFTHYGMPDIDTDGGLWFQWYLHHIAATKSTYDITSLTAYPAGYDIAFAPVFNLIYTIQALLAGLGGFHWSKLIATVNISTLLAYPLSSLGAALFMYALTKSRLAAFFAGLGIGFSFYFILMGRGQMSINHVEFIPFFLFLLVRYIQKPTLTRNILAGLFLAIMFMADAYYAFFSGIFSTVLLLFLPDTSWRSRITRAIAFYSVAFTLLFFCNFSFILGNLYLFDTSTRVQSGRVSGPENELVPISIYFQLLPNSLVYGISPFLALLFGIAPLSFIVYGYRWVRQKQLFTVLLFCFLLAVVLSASVSGLRWVNDLYFQFFGMFRGVGRLNVSASLFLGALVGLVASEGYRLVSPRKKRLAQLGLVGLAGIIIVSGLNRDGTWTWQTDFSTMEDLYSGVRNNPDIHTIAPYPMSLGAVETGFPQTYQLLGQIIHQKPLASGANPFDEVTVQHYRKIRDLHRPETIDILAKNGIDTILLYDNLLSDYQATFQELSRDERLTLIGKYSAEKAGEHASLFDFSKDISVFHIKNAEPLYERPLISLERQNGEVDFTKLSASRYVIDVKNWQEGDRLLFRSTYSNKWKLYPGEMANQPDLAFLFSQPLDVSHERVDEFDNAWTLQHGGRIVLYFVPQARYALGNLFLLLGLGLSCVGIIFDFIWSRRRLSRD